MDLDRLTKYWQDYRDEERSHFTPAEWEMYRILFRRSMTFPEWIERRIGSNVENGGSENQGKSEGVLEGLSGSTQLDRTALPRINVGNPRLEDLGSQGRSVDTGESVPVEISWAQCTILEALMSLEEDAYGTTISKKVQEMIGTPVHYPLLRSQLANLMERNLITSEVRQNGHVHYKSTTEGVRAAVAYRTTLS